ncbi:MAG: 16S rRNA (cytosine(1402)-N(4))-methyltransferase RsmH [Phycisphaera sp.]|nr:MAG: 16S rRNA (cytosine(1402)-N(4))-methyltransferase RsmH [Phycisphaera sp.]
MANDPRVHIPVLMDEVIALLDPKPGEVYADATAGLGGHAREVAKRIGPAGVVVLGDLDMSNLSSATQSVAERNKSRILTHHGSFADLPRFIENEGLKVDLLLADLGFASNQVDDPSRGLTFREDGPLDMRLDTSGQLTAADLVNELGEQELADVIYRYGEERASRRIARAIVERRKQQKFDSTSDLADIVRRSAGPPPKGRKRIDRATRTFQALRIAVNGEIESLDALLEQIRIGCMKAASGKDSWLSQGARVGVISFHSLEDRPVKRMFQQIEQAGDGRRLTRKPAVAGEAEERSNPRARSAKLRVLQVLDETRPDAR